jgi:PAS domain S-box-containing protein
MSTDAPHYTILDVNNAYLHATNSTRESLVGKSVFAVFPANPTDDVSKNIERTIFSFEEAIRSKKTHTMSNYRYDIPIPGTDEFEERYWTTSNTPVLDAEGNVLYFIHSPANVTENYKLAQREKAGVLALHNQRQQLYSVFMQAPVGIVILKGNDLFVELVNDNYLALVGKKRDQFENRPLWEGLPEVKSQVFNDLLMGVMKTGIAYHGNELEANIVRNGKPESLYFNFVYEPLKEPDGRVSGVLVVAIDVTAMVVSKQQIQDAEERARLAVDAARLGIFDLDLVTDQMITTPQFDKIFGFDEHMGHSAYVNVIHPDDLATRIKAHQDALESGRLFYEIRVLWPDGSVHWIRVEGKVFYKDNGKAHRILGTLLDITEQRNLQQQKDDFIGIASHELKTPVTSIKAYTQVLEKVLSKKGDTREAAMISKMDSQIDRLTSLIGDLLDVTKINSGKLSFNDRWFDFDQLVTELVEDIQHTTDKHTIVLELNGHNSVYADRERISQVITNLITNGIKYSPNADTIVVRTSFVDNEAKLCVQDFGIGISKRQQEKVFEQFYRVSGDMQHTFPGLGLGLYISSEIIKREGGRIWVTSKVGEGSTFCFALPIKQQQI